MLFSISLHAVLDSHLYESLVLKFFVDVSKQLLVLVATFSLVNFISDFGSFLCFFLRDFHFNFLLVQRADSYILIIGDIFVTLISAR